MACLAGEAGTLHVEGEGEGETEGEGGGLNAGPLPIVARSRAVRRVGSLHRGGKPAAGYDLNSLALSPDGRRAAWTATRRYDRTAPVQGPDGAVLLDEEGQPRVERRLVVERVLCVDGSDRAVEGEVFPGSLRWSPNGKWLTYMTLIRERVHVGLETNLSKGYLDVARPGPVFSPDSRHVAFAAQVERAEGAEGMRIVHDGVEGPIYDLIDGRSVVFSPDGSRLAYAARKGDGSYLILDGKELGPYDGVMNNGAFLLFGPQGRRTAYFVRQGEKVRLVLDGTLGDPFLRTIVDGAAFDSSGTRFAYVAVEAETRTRMAVEKRMRMVVDGERQSLYRKIVRPLFSPDGKRLAYAAQGLDSQYMVVDGVKSLPYPGIAPNVVAWRPDGGELSFGVLGVQDFYIIQGQGDSRRRHGPFQRLGVGSLTYSPDGKHLAWAAVAGMGWRVFVDGVPGPVFERIRPDSLRFGPDGAHLVYVVASAAGQAVVVNHRVGDYHQEIPDLPGAGPRFDGPREIRYMVVSSKDLRPGGAGRPLGVSLETGAQFDLYEIRETLSP